MRIGVSLLIILIAISVPVEGQPGLYSWGTDADETGNLYILKNSSYIFTGMSNNSGIEEILVAKFDLQMNVLWSKTFGGNTREESHGFAELSNGNYLITCVGNNLGNSTFHLLLDKNGNLLTSKRIGSFADRLDRVLPTQDGGALVYGELEGLVPGNNKVAVVKYDKDLNVQWSEYFDYQLTSDYISGFEMYGRDAVELSDGSYLVLGSYAEINNAAHNRKIRIMKLTKEGAVEWVKGIYGGQMDNAWRMALTNDNAFVILATTNSYSVSGTDFLVIKADLDGNIQWIKTFGGSLNEVAHQIWVDDANETYFTGTTNSFGNGGTQSIVVELDADGNIIMSKAFGENDNFLVDNFYMINDQLVLGGTIGATGSRDLAVMIVNKDLPDQMCEETQSVSLTSQSVVTTIYNGIYPTSSVPALQDSPVTTKDLSFHSGECTICTGGFRTDTTICENDVFQIDLTGGTSYLWNDGQTSSSRSISKSGLYWVDILGAICPVRDTFNIATRKLPFVDLGADTILCKDENLVFDLGYLNYSLHWQDGSTDTVYTIGSPGVYILAATNQCGTYVDSIAVSQKELGGVFIPNVFTPNGDGKNDSFVIDSKLLGAYVEVFNRWGKKVYEQYNYQNDWNGGKNPPGIYYYNIVDQCTGVPFKGWVQIVK